MRALFLVPPVGYGPRATTVDRVYGCNYGFDYKPPIHLLQVATYARDALGWDVRLLDAPAEGLDRRQFESLAANERYDVALYWTTYLSAAEDLAAARVIRDRSPATRHVFMGTAATWRPEEFTVNADTYCLLGEPEHTLRDLAAAWAYGRGVAGIDGLAWWEGSTLARGGFRRLLDVSTLPMPDRRLLLGRYTANRLGVDRMTVMVVSRGCGFRCTFCTPNAVDQAIELEYKRTQARYVDRPPLRKRTVDQIVAELEDIAALGFAGVEIADNVFTWGKARTVEICRRIEPLGLAWLCLARANMLHDDVTLKAMHDAGCKLIYMGSESFDDGLLADMAKDLKVADVRKAIDTCRRNGVEPEVSVLMGGSPHETWTTLWRSWRAARGLGTPFVHFSVALPAPSTELYDLARENGWFVDGDFVPTDNQRDVIVNLPNLSAGELRLALKLAYAGQYLTPPAIIRQVRQVRSFGDLRSKARAAGRLLGYLGEARDGARDGGIPPGRVTPIDGGSPAPELQ
jgi:radical SAM superfamily enzyme YgiQ (UPF0313 family)